MNKLEDEIGEIIMPWEEVSGPEQVKQLLSLFKREMEKVIGEDDRPVRDNKENPMTQETLINFYRNDLRSEQRKRLESLLKE